MRVGHVIWNKATVRYPHRTSRHNRRVLAGLSSRQLSNTSFRFRRHHAPPTSKLAPTSINDVGSGTGVTLTLSMPASIVDERVTLARLVQLRFSSVAVVKLRKLEFRVPPPTTFPTKDNETGLPWAIELGPANRLVRLKGGPLSRVKVIVFPPAKPNQDDGFPSMVVEFAESNTAEEPFKGRN